MASEVLHSPAPGELLLQYIQGLGYDVNPRPVWPSWKRTAMAVPRYHRPEHWG